MKLTRTQLRLRKLKEDPGIPCPRYRLNETISEPGCLRTMEALVSSGMYFTPKPNIDLVEPVGKSPKNCRLAKTRIVYITTLSLAEDRVKIVLFQIG